MFSNTKVLEVETLESTWLLGDQIFVFVMTLAAAMMAIFAFYLCRNHGALSQILIPEITSNDMKTPRFRKRDKVLFYGKRMLRKVRSISSASGKRKRILAKLTRKLLDKETPKTRLQVVEPSAEYLEEDLSKELGQRLPLEVSYMLQSIRVLGSFEMPLFLELCKHIVSTELSAGQFLFRIGNSNSARGDPDQNFFVVQSGKLNVFITENDGKVISLKVVKPGDSIASLLSFTDVLTGHTQPLKTVSAQALERSIVLTLPVAAFQGVFEKNPETFVRVIQIIMVRLSRVTFTALHQHMGLSHELVLSQKKRYNSPSKRPSSNQLSGMDETLKNSDFFECEPAGDPYCTQSTTTSVSSDPYVSLNLQSSTSSGNVLRKRSSTPFSSSISTSAASSVGRETESGLDVLEMEQASFVSMFADSETAMEAKMKCAVTAFANNLGLDDNKLIRDSLHIRTIPAGAYLAKEDMQDETGLIYVLQGLLTSYQQDDDKEIIMYTVYEGEFVGGLSVLTGEPSSFSIRARQLTTVAVMPYQKFYDLMSQYPKIVLNVAHIVVKRLSPFVRQIDFAIDWVFCESGRALYRQGDDSDSTYILLSGRLRSVITRPDGKKQLVAEYGRGDLIGIVEALTRTTRSTTVVAVRDSELAKLPEGLLNLMKIKYPIVVTRLINLLGHRILGSWKQSIGGHLMSDRQAAYEQKPSHSNFSTIAVLATSESIPISAFTFELIHSLSSQGSALRLTSDYIKKTLGISIMESSNEYKLGSWLAQQEDQHRIVLYQCDHHMTLWTQRCIRQADCILIVGMGNGNPSIGKIEKEMGNLAIRTQKDLVLLYKETEKPKDTAVWLNCRQWCSSHHHLKCPKRMFSRKAKTSDYFSMINRTEPNVHSDFSRLARWLTGESVGLVLGGGGARGAAHIGLIKSIEEAGIPIDMVGGVSIGAFMGGLYCMERNIVSVTQHAREWSKKMTQWWRQVWDLTYPVTSMFTGAGFNQTIIEAFGDTQIEDLWLPYFTVTTDVTSSCMRVHTYGSLWRYIRASMTLSGYFPALCDPTDGHLLLDGGYVNNLPAICDPEDGHLLVDGCYVNNVPADVMRNRGAAYILAVDVGSQDDTDLTNYGDSLSGWWLLWQKFTSAFRTTVIKVPNLPDIQSRLAYVSCVRQLEEVRNSDYCHYVRPPIDRYKTLQFASFDEIKEVGYNHGKTYFDGMMKGGTIPSICVQGGFGPKAQQRRRKSISGHLRTERKASGSYNFIDLAQLICKVRKGPESDEDASEEDTDYNEGYASEPAFPRNISVYKSTKRATYDTYSENELDSATEAI